MEKRMKFQLTIKGKKVEAWMDFDLWEAEKEWIKQKELEYAKNWMVGLLPFQCGVPPDNRNYPLTHFIMANIITKDKATRESVERHMKNSIEYENPNLKNPLRAKFPTPNSKDEQRVLNSRDLERLIKDYQYQTRALFGGWRVDEDFHGFFTYSPQGLMFDKNEVKIEFTSGSDCINKLNKVINDLPRYLSNV